MKKMYYSLERAGQTATINIYGDITSWAWEELGEMSAVNLSKKLDEIGDVEQIDVYINSYGGEVAEGLAIYNALRRHKAKITTYCDGFACSIASVIFMAGDERVMNESSLLMIHNAWMYAAGNADELRKQAEDLEKINQASIEAYKSHSSLTEDEIKDLMNKETWILPEEALSYGFATSIDRTNNEKASQSAFLQLFKIIKAHQAAEDEDEEADDTDSEEPDNNTGTNDTEPDEDEPSTEDEIDEESDEESDDDETDKGAAQKWGGFFNAILK